MENHLYRYEFSKSDLGEESLCLKELKYFLVPEERELDKTIHEKFPYDKYGDQNEEIRILGSKTLRDTYEKIDADKYDFLESFDNVEYVGMSHDNQMILNFKEKEVSATSIYTFKSEFLGSFFIDKYVQYCSRNEFSDIIKENLTTLFKKFQTKEKQYRLIRDKEDEWRIRGYTSDKYNNYDNGIVLYLTLLTIHKYAKENDLYFYMHNAFISDSAIYIMFEQQKPIRVNNVGDVYIGIAVSNGEIRNRTFRFDVRYRIVNPETNKGFSAILNTSLFVIRHDYKVETVEENLKGISRLGNFKDNILRFINDINYAEPLSADTMYQIIRNLLNRITTSGDISSNTKTKFKQSEILNVVKNTLTLVDFFDKVNSISTDVDERIFVERIIHQVITDYANRTRE